MRTRSVWLPLAAAVVMSVASPVAADVAQDLAHYAQRTGPKPVLGATDVLPASPNPYLALLPEKVEPDWVYWNARGSEIARGRAAVDPASRGALPTVRYREREPAGIEADNNDSASAEWIARVGTDNGKVPRASVTGFTHLAEFDVGASIEDDGAIPLANEIILAAGIIGRANGVIGDGPHGSAASGSGDFDFFALPGLQAGETLIVDVDTPVPFGDLDPFVVLWNSAGTVIAFNDDDGQSFDSALAQTIPAPGHYFVSIGGYGSFQPADPFNSASGPGAGSEGDYVVRFSVGESVDYYAVDLQLGDVIGATAVGGREVALYAPDGTLLIGTGRDPSFLYPAASRLPGGGATIAHVATESGRFAIRVATVKDYKLDIRVFRPGLSEVASRQEQILFIDFDGAVVDTTIFDAEPPQPRTLSPLVDFLSGWGLTPADENAVIDAILDTVQENLADDLGLLGLNGDRETSGNPTEFAIEIRNNRDHVDPFGEPNVSRIIVGGTIAESGIETVGIAQSIDPGNLDRNETALVLLDTLAAPAGGSSMFRLNNIALDPSVSMIDLIGVAVGNIIAHEAGHYFGNWHTDQFNPVPEIMDQGGNPASTFGLGTDGAFGTADDVDVDVDLDVFVPNEGFFGIEDTRNRSAFGLSTGRRARGG